MLLKIQAEISTTLVILLKQILQLLPKRLLEMWFSGPKSTWITTSSGRMFWTTLRTRSSLWTTLKSLLPIFYWVSAFPLEKSQDITQGKGSRKDRIIQIINCPNMRMIRCKYFSINLSQKNFTSINNFLSLRELHKNVHSSQNRKYALFKIWIYS